MKLTVLLAAFLALTLASTNAAPVAPTLKGDLVALAGKKAKRFDDTKLATTKYYAVYFSAHWCGPCRAFTPELVKWYKANKAANPHFELIFVSSDHTEKDMEKYMAEAEMPWPALAFNKKKSNKSLAPLAGSGIPSLVFLDADGKVLSNSYEGSKYVGPNKVLADIDTTLKANPAAK